MRGRGTVYWDGFEARGGSHIGPLSFAPLSASVAASFVYDGDGRRVAQSINGVTTYFVGNYYEKQGSTITKYYYAGSQRVAMRLGSTVYYLLADHLGSTSLTLNASGSVISELRYSAWGSVRYQAGATPTEYTFTGQYGYDFGLMYFNARWLDVYLNHFTQPDTIVALVSQGTQALDPYAFVNNNPLRYTDPTGHIACDEVNANGRCYTEKDITNGVKDAESNHGCSDLTYCPNGKPKKPSSSLEDIVQRDDDVSQLPDVSTAGQLESYPEMCAANSDGCILAGALLIIFTDLFVGLPLAAVIFSTGGVTPPAIAAEALETLVVLPINILGIALIAKGSEVKDRGR